MPSTHASLCVVFSAYGGMAPSWSQTSHHLTSQSDLTYHSPVRTPLALSSLSAAEEFYVPGCTHRSWNKVPPVLRIMMRVEVRGGNPT